MLDRQQISAVLDQLVDTVGAGSAGQQKHMVGRLDRLSAAELLLLDAVGRSPTMAGCTAAGAVRRAKTRDRHGLLEAVLQSMDGNGHLRQAAVARLRLFPGTLSAAFLACRLLDHVFEVRRDAARSLVERPFDDLEWALAVVLTGAHRKHTEAAIHGVEQRLRQFGEPGLRRLRSSRHGSVQRWAYRRSLEEKVLDRSELRAMVLLGGSDQLLRAWCAEALAERADPDDIALLSSGSLAAGRLAALTHVPEAQLADDQLTAFLTDRSAAVRRAAGLRARRRGVDVHGRYRRLVQTEQSPRRLAACLDGLVDSGEVTDDGGLDDLSVFRDLADHAAPRVRAAAVRATGRRATPEQLRELVGPRLLDPTARVATAAARELARSASADARASLELAWMSTQPWSRRAAWIVLRSRGGWDRVEADIRAAADSDRALAAAGVTSVGDWLVRGAATTYGRPPPEQQRRMAASLPQGGLSPASVRLIVFHAGLPEPGPAASSGTERPRFVQRLRDRVLRRRSGRSPADG